MVIQSFISIVKRQKYYFLVVTLRHLRNAFQISYLHSCGSGKHISSLSQHLGSFHITFSLIIINIFIINIIIIIIIIIIILLLLLIFTLMILASANFLCLAAELSVNCSPQLRMMSLMNNCSTLMPQSSVCSSRYYSNLLLISSLSSKNC